MALSRTTSRLFNKAPTYTRPAPYAGPATPWGLSEQRKTMGPDGRQTPYTDRLKAYYNYARPFVNPGNGFTMADVMQMNVPGTYPPGPDASRNLSQQNPMPSPTGFKEPPHNGPYNGIVINQPDGQLNLGDPNNYKAGSGMRNFFGEMRSLRELGYGDANQLSQGNPMAPEGYRNNPAIKLMGNQYTPTGGPPMTIGGVPVRPVPPQRDQFSDQFRMDYQSPGQYDARAESRRAAVTQSQSSWGEVSPQNPVQQAPPQTEHVVSSQKFMQSPVNMSGLQNKSMASTMGLAGLIPGFGGAASQGYLAALGKGYSAAQSLNQQNPMQSPALIGGRSMPAGGNPVEWARAQAEIARRDAPQGSKGPVGMPPGLNSAQIAQWNQSQAEIANRGSFQPPDNQQYAARWQGPVQPGSLDLWASQMSGIDPNRVNEIPAPQNSLQAGANAQGSPMNQSTSAMSNGYYSPPDSVNQGRQYGLTLPMDQAGQQNMIANQNPMYQGMQSRFGAGSVLGQQAATIAAGDSTSRGPDATTVDIPGGYGEMPTYLNRRPEPEVMLRPNGRGNNVSYIPPTDPVLDRQFNALKNFKPGAERGANRKAAREATKARLADSRFKMQVSKGLNPNSAKAKAMFPAQVAKMQGTSPGNPMAASPFKPDAPNTPENRDARVTARRSNYENSPTIQSIGVDDTGASSDFASGLSNHLASNDVSEQGVQDIFNHIKTYAPEKKGEPTFPGGKNVLGADMLNELWGMPEDTPLPVLTEWLGKYKAELARRRAAADWNAGAGGFGV